MQPTLELALSWTNRIEHKCPIGVVRVSFLSLDFQTEALQVPKFGGLHSFNVICSQIEPNASRRDVVSASAQIASGLEDVLHRTAWGHCVEKMTLYRVGISPSVLGHYLPSSSSRAAPRDR
jgi:hypothetical protein